jgi:hypothetical protein
MKTSRIARISAQFARLALGLAVAATLAVTAGDNLTAHAAANPALPRITVSDSDWGPLNPHVLVVQGVDFTVNSPVLIEVLAGNGAVVAEAATISWGDGSAGDAHAGAIRAALRITVSHGLRGLHIFALDRTSGVRSNTVIFPIPHCKQYQCF